jgi:uncharacterized protein (TIGR03086 family)
MALRRNCMTQLDPSSATEWIVALAASVRDDQLNDPTPLPAYRARELLDNTGGPAQAFTCAVRKERNELTERTPTDPSGPLLDDWRSAIPRDLDILAAARAEPDAWNGETRIAGGDNPASVVGLVVTDELVVHGWDSGSDRCGLRRGPIARRRRQAVPRPVREPRPADRRHGSLWSAQDGLGRRQSAAPRCSRSAGATSAGHGSLVGQRFGAYVHGSDLLQPRTGR